MPLDPDRCWDALRARDRRFDGHFFVAVRTTRIYCRPICPAPPPRREHCAFYPSAAAAQEAGYRPCLRCRPETSPGTPAWAGTSATVSRALRLIAGGALDGGSVRALAATLGIGERHLGRLFRRHLGATPLTVAHTRRLHAAKRLLDETDLPITDVAHAAGFGSLRRFNRVVQETWQRTPRELRARRRRNAVATAPGITLRLPYREPFDWAAIAGFLAHRAIPGVEVVTADAYRRALRVGDATGVVEVRPVAGASCLTATIRLDRPGPLLQVADRVRQVFDLDADPHAIGEHLCRDAVLRARWADMPGIRVPGAWSGFELAVRAILGQQVSVRGATTLAGRLAAAYGERVDDALLFPTPERLAGADLRGIGLPGARAQALAALAAAVADGRLDLDTPGVPETLDALRNVPGIGDWTVQYVAMRALRHPDAFLPTDVGVLRALAVDGVRPTPREAARRAERWSPWRAYALMLLWLAGDEAPAGRRASA